MAVRAKEKKAKVGAGGETNDCYSLILLIISPDSSIGDLVIQDLRGSALGLESNILSCFLNSMC